MELVKICQKCNVQLSISAFSKSKNTKDGLQPSCKSCNNMYYEAHKVELAEYRRLNKDKIAEYKKVYRKENKSEIAEDYKVYRKENKSEIAAYKKVYYQENIAKYSAYVSKRRASKLNATPIWLTTEHFEQIEQFYIKSRQLTLLTGIKHHVDHIIPLQGKTVCGLHVPWNLQVLTAAENIGKSNKLQT